MIQSFFLKNYRLFFFSLIILIVSCTDGNKDKDKPVEAVTEPTPATAVAAPASLTGGMLDTLWVDSASFARLANAKLVFSFVFETNDTLTLHGWSVKGGGVQFPPDPDIKLLKGRASTLTYGNGTYFGNVVLAQSDINKIQNKLKSEKAQYVVFAPQKLGNHIGYTVYVSKENPAILVKILVVIPTGADANPSPPKNY